MRIPTFLLLHHTVGIAIACVLGLGGPLMYAGIHAWGHAGLSLTGQLAVCMTVGLAMASAMYLCAGRWLLPKLRAQHAQQLRFHTAIDNINIGLCFFDGSQRLIVCNHRYLEIYKLSRDAVQPGTPLREIVDMTYAAGTCSTMTREEYLTWRSSVAVAKVPSNSVVKLQDGRTLAIHHQPMSDGCWVSTHEDITEQRRAQAQIERMAHHDALTGLPNRLLFRERLSSALKTAAAGDTVAVLYIDLDRFKDVNDTLGHPTGDQLLRAAAQRLCDCVRHNDLVARLGGDEFAIIQTRAPQPAAAQTLSDRLVGAIAAPFEIDGHQVIVGASVGVVLSTDERCDPDDLLKMADMALYDAKSAGRGTHRFFRAALSAEAADRRALELDLAQAVPRGELVLHYQPIVSTATQGIVAFEALLRWHHPTHGLVMPDRFISLAEDTGLIEPLGAWVLGEAFAQAAKWPAHVAVAVNLSPVQFKSGRLVTTVARALDASGLAPSRAELEITESVRLAEDAADLGQLHQLHALGARVSLDDFGVGYSSLSYLRSFPFRKLKIDRSFVRDVVGNNEARAIVRAITALGASLQMAVTAEGVETAEQFQLLRDLGCTEAQGWHFGRPQPAPQATALIGDDRRQALAESPRLSTVRAWPPAR